MSSDSDLIIITIQRLGECLGSLQISIMPHGESLHEKEIFGYVNLHVYCIMRKSFSLKMLYLCGVPINILPGQKILPGYARVVCRDKQEAA